MSSLQRRAQPSTLMMFASPVIAAVCMLVTGYLLFTFLGKAPLHAFWVFFIKPLTTAYGIGEWLLKATPLILCGLKSKQPCDCLMSMLFPYLLMVRVCRLLLICPQP